MNARNWGAEHKVTVAYKRTECIHSYDITVALTKPRESRRREDFTPFTSRHKVNSKTLVALLRWKFWAVFARPGFAVSVATLIDFAVTFKLVVWWRLLWWLWRQRFIPFSYSGHFVIGLRIRVTGISFFCHAIHHISSASDTASLHLPHATVYVWSFSKGCQFLTVSTHTLILCSTNVHKILPINTVLSKINTVSNLYSGTLGNILISFSQLRICLENCLFPWVIFTNIFNVF